MYFADHNPPHFHVRYGGHKAVISIRDLSLLEGRIPPRVLGMVVEWALRHQEELLRNWELARNNQHPSKIIPLD
ncbi:TPA: DUF4160 domain-containing protein [Candidatus Poribacteria bacterium]|nr:DUF4160 domain-containing protein [Candidatus Poribacteria bacterium]